jgi:hypothetical protein
MVKELLTAAETVLLELFVHRAAGINGAPMSGWRGGAAPTQK